MSSKLNMQDIIDLLVAKNVINKEEAESFIVELFNLIEKGLTADEQTKIKDFGTFKLTHIQARESIDVNTQEKILIPAHRRVTFVPAQLLKSLVNKPFAHFETTPLNEGVFMEGISQNSFVDVDVVENRYEDDEERVEDSEPIEEGETVKIESAILLKEEEPIDEKKDIGETIVPVNSSASESNIEDTIATENSAEDIQNEEIKEKETIIVAQKPLTDTTSTKKKSKRFILWLNIALVLLVVFSVGFAYNYYTSNNSSDLVVDTNETVKPFEDVSVATTQNPLDEGEAVVDSVEIALSLPRKTAKMSPGRTLRLIALDKLGDKEFWIYIYMINKDKIENPNVVPIGLLLDLPHENEYPMDATNPEDISTAKEKGDKILKSFR